MFAITRDQNNDITIWRNRLAGAHSESAYERLGRGLFTLGVVRRHLQPVRLVYRQTRQTDPAVLSLDVRPQRLIGVCV